MKLHILSDLHTEFADFGPPETDADAVILAGDIGVGLEGLRWAARHFPDRPIVYVPGNHEFYGHDIALTGSLKSEAPRNISVLSDDRLVLDGVRFLGTTLWTDFKLHGEADAWFARQRAGPTVVVTHHLPASSSIAKRYADDPLNPAFASRLEGLIEAHQPTLWVHGHTHEPFDYELFGTRVVCNPRGYPGEQDRIGFRPDLTVVV
jgi:Icc-related predicted phosphoesterase